MSNLADRIERYLKKILNEAEAGFIVLQRALLAEEFDCVPSQINYVLGTRFTVERGYLVESRRGGGGYLRIVRLGTVEKELHETMRDLIGDGLSQDRAYDLIERLLEEGLVAPREAEIIRGAIARETLGLDAEQRDLLRARILKQILIILCREDLV